MSIAGTVTIPFEGDFGRINKGLTSFMGSALGKFSGLEKFAKSSFVRIGAVGAAVGFGLFKIGESFDKAYDTIRVGTGATGSALAKLKGDFKSVIQAVPTDFGSASLAISELNARLGLTGQPLQRMAKQFLELSRITKTDLEGNIENATKAFGAFMVPLKEQPAALDALYRATQVSGVGMDQLADNARVLSAPLRALGFSFLDSVSLMAQFEKTGVNTTTAMAGLRMGVRNLAKAGEDVPVTFRRILDEIKNAKDPADALNLSFKLFGTRAGTDLADAIQVGAFSLEELYKTIAGGKDTIMGASKDTQDFGEKWQKIKNQILVKLEPVAERVFDGMGKLIDFLGTSGGKATLALVGMFAAVRIGTGVVGALRAQTVGLSTALGAGGLTGTMSRMGAAAGLLGFGLLAVKPALDDMGASAAQSGAAVGAIAGLPFGPWGVLAGGAIGAVAGAFGLLGDRAKENLEQSRIEMEKYEAYLTGLAERVQQDHGKITAATVEGLLKQNGSYKDTIALLSATGVSWDRFVEVVSNQPDFSDAWRLELGWTDREMQKFANNMGGFARDLHNVQGELLDTAVVQRDLTTIVEVSKTAWENAEARTKNLAARSGEYATKVDTVNRTYALAIASAHAYANELVLQDGNTVRANESLALARVRLVDSLVAAGMARGEARKLAVELLTLGEMKSTPRVHLDDSEFKNKVQAARVALMNLGRSWAKPGVGGATKGASVVWLQHGGPVAGSRSTAVPIMAHGGEYVLDADVVDRIKRGVPSAGAGAGGAGGVPVHVHVAGSVITEGQLVDTIDKALARRAREGRRQS